MTNLRPTSKRRRQIYSVLPLLFLLLCIGGINMMYRIRSPQTETGISVSTMTNPVDDATQLARLGTETAVPTATAIPSATPTPLPTPTIPVTATITLMGPPDHAVFATTDMISFYWRWPLPLAEGQLFSLYQLTETEDIILGSLTEPNVGSSYRLRIPATRLAETAVIPQWTIRLETTTHDTLVSSESRSLTLRTP